MTISKLVRYSTDLSKLSFRWSHTSPVLLDKLKGIEVVSGKVIDLPPKVKLFVEASAELCKPERIHICSGSETENKCLISRMLTSGALVPLPKYENCWLARTNPADTARVESKTFNCSDEKSESIPTPKEGVKGQVGNWISMEDMNQAVKERFTGCMKGRTMYVIPFNMGPIASPLSKVGIQLTDSAYVVASMKIMTRMGTTVLQKLHSTEEFVKCLHSVGTPKNGKIEYPSWPCDPERTIILQRPKHDEIVSYGSGYGGNSLLGKKCFALRIGSTIAKREGWLAEHMLIVGITNPQGKKKYIAAAFPSACGKTNLAMMQPSLPGYKVECVGDDIAWMRFDKNGILRGINPENGFFGVAPGTSNKTNPIAMKTVFKNTIFTNVAETSDGGVFWEGMEDEVDFKKVTITDWKGKTWTKGDKTMAAQANSRFCTPAAQCPIIDEGFEDPEGVPISAIIFGGRRPEGVPLVYEARDWQHGVFIGAAMKSETTAAAEHKGKAVMHDPFAMRPFFGYNFGHYMKHWLSMQSKSQNLPKIFHVNWFRKGTDGKFLWPGFGENSRVIEWILKRLDNEPVYDDSPIGYIPKPNCINLKGLEKENININELFRIDKDFWQKEAVEIEGYFDEQLGKDLPHEVCEQLEALKKRIASMH